MLMLDPDPKAFRCHKSYQQEQCRRYCGCGARGGPQHPRQMVVGLMPEIKTGAHQMTRGAEGLKQLANQ
eukprot:3971667-Prymnesium_polylepis.1